MPNPAAPGSKSAGKAQRLALNAAIALRDCSLRRDTTLAERLACRSLVRGEALRWRDPVRTVFGL